MVSFAEDKDGKFNVGFATSYGVGLGFGYPWLSASAQPATNVGCSVKDFFVVMKDYLLESGRTKSSRVRGRLEGGRELHWRGGCGTGAKRKIRLSGPQPNLESLRAKEGIQLSTRL